VYVCGVYMCTGVYQYVCKSVFMFTCVLIAWYNDTDSFVQSKLSNGRFESVAVMDPIGDLKIDARDDPEIRTGSCSEDQRTIQIQNCIISCECLLLCYFLMYRCQ